jgi:hypothetical protein
MRQARCSVRTIVNLVLGVGLTVLVWSGAAIWAAAAPFKAAATIFPLYDLVRNVTGPAADVVLLIPPGASPHTFATRPGTLRALANSAVIFAIGHGPDDWVARLAQDAGVPQVTVVDQRIALRKLDGEAIRITGSPLPTRYAWCRRLPRRWESSILPIGKSIVSGLQPIRRNSRLRSRNCVRRWPISHSMTSPRFIRRSAILPRRTVCTWWRPLNTPRAMSRRHATSNTACVRSEPTISACYSSNPQLPEERLSGLASALGVVLQVLDPLGGDDGRDSSRAMMHFNAAQIAAALRE